MRECFHLTDAWTGGLTERDGEYAWRCPNQEFDDYLRLPEAEQHLVHGGEHPFRSGALELQHVDYV